MNKRSTNPFEDDGDSFDASSGNPGLATFGNFQPEPRMIQNQIFDSQTRTKLSQERALASIYNSEQIGVASAQELMEQGEKLSRAENQLQAISEIQKDSQRKLNTMSSVFGGLRNIFSRKPSVGTTDTSNSNSSRSDNFNTVNQTAQPFKPVNSSLNNVSQNHTDNFSSNQKSHDVEFERNINLMNDGMSRLKSLAMGMNEELRTQNNQLDRMAPQLDRINDTMAGQNKQMNKLLGIQPK